jgi:hypothetical protein
MGVPKKRKSIVPIKEQKKKAPWLRKSLLEHAEKGGRGNSKGLAGSRSGSDVGIGTVG